MSPVGDPVCWLPRVCPECGQLADAEPPTTCARCGTRIGLDGLDTDAADPAAAVAAGAAEQTQDREEQENAT